MLFKYNFLKGISYRKYPFSSFCTKSIIKVDEHCRELVKKHDFENYLGGLLVPKQYQSAFFAIRAFNIEIATIKDSTHSNPHSGRIRFQWWRDIIDQIYAGKDIARVEQQPVARALIQHIKENNLTKRWFDRSLEAREKNLTSEQPDTLDDLEDYGEKGHSSILYLLLESMNIRDDNTMYVASHIGVCSGIITLLRGLPHHVSQGEINIPSELMMKYNLSRQIVLAGPNTQLEKENLKAAIFDIASQAYAHMDRARVLQDEKIDTSIYALFPAIRSNMYLEDLRKADFFPFDSDLNSQSSHFELQLKILRSSWTKKF
jgi:NADH dehydrogenase [ubiquinone] 1 alpha subcomplex assembly factor 6